MHFSNIPGLHTIKMRLVSQIDEDRQPHAQIFIGRRGTSKLALAWAYACYLLCIDRQESGPCGVCRSCIKSYQLMHPDLHFVFPVVKKGSKKREDTTSQDFMMEWRSALQTNPYLDINEWSHLMHTDRGQPNINTKECAEMIRQLGMRAFESKYKVQIIWLPEYLGKEGNRLLKMIEEPTDNTIIILVAEHQEKILPTVLSRCQLVKVPPASSDENIRYLQQKFPDLQENIIAQSVLMTDGDIYHAQHILAGSDIDFSELLLSWMRLSYKRSYGELDSWVGILAQQGREDIKHFLDYCLSYLREYTFYLHTGNDQRLNDAQKSTMNNMKKIIDMDKIESVTLLLQDSRRSIIRNINPKIALMAASVELGDILRAKQAHSSLYKA